MSPIDVTVHIRLPVTHVNDHVPGEARLTRVGVGVTPGARVVNVAHVWVWEVALGSGTREVRGGGRGHGRRVQLLVPVVPSDAQQVLKSRGSKIFLSDYYPLFANLNKTVSDILWNVPRSIIVL